MVIDLIILIAVIVVVGIMVAWDMNKDEKNEPRE